VDESALAGLRDGIAVDGVFYGAIEASLERIQGTNAWLTIGLREGKNREVKNILGALGLEVTRLIRVSFGPFQLGELPEGEVQELKGRTLRDQLGERLIAEAGANFEAPVTKPFSNRAEQVRAPEERTVRGPARVAIEPGEGGLIKSRKRRREEARDDALGRLSTRPERGSFGDRGDRPAFRDKPFGKPGFGKGGERGEGREKRAPEPPKSRKSNVWMAPGARPQGKSETKRTPSKGGKGSGPRSSSPRRPRKD
jgi:23S rRNA pseudouridine2605 synthase